MSTRHARAALEALTQLNRAMETISFDEQSLYMEIANTESKLPDHEVALLAARRHIIELTKAVNSLGMILTEYITETLEKD